MLRRIAIGAVLAVVLVSGHCVAAFAAVAGGVSCSSWWGDGTEQCTFDMTISGDIDASTVADVAQLFDAAADEPRLMGEMIKIDSPGGNIDAAMKIGRMFREHHHFLTVDRGSRCASACVMILVGAVAREVGGLVGIHRPYTTDLNMSPSDVERAYGSLLTRMRNYLREMNVSEGLVDAMLAVPPDRMRYLSKSELVAYGLTPTDPVWQETVDLGEARKWHLGRLEYMRRKQIVDAECGNAPDGYISCLTRTMEGKR